MNPSACLRTFTQETSVRVPEVYVHLFNFSTLETSQEQKSTRVAGFLAGNARKKRGSYEPICEDSFNV